MLNILKSYQVDSFWQSFRQDSRICSHLYGKADCIFRICMDDSHMGSAERK